MIMLMMDPATMQSDISSSSPSSLPVNPPDAMPRNIYGGKQRHHAVERVFPIRVREPEKARDSLTSNNTLAQAPYPETQQHLTVPSHQLLEVSMPPDDAQIVNQNVQLDSLQSPVPCLLVNPPQVAGFQQTDRQLPEVDRYVTQRLVYGPLASNIDTCAISDVQRVFRCEDEPICTPGAVQSFGVLIALKQNNLGQLVVRIASENSAKITGLTSEYLFGLQCFTDVLSATDRLEMLLRIQSLATNEVSTTPDVFRLSIKSDETTSVSLFCAVHFSEQSNLIICEFEPAQEILKRVHPPEEGYPEEPVHILDHQDFNPEQLRTSTTSTSIPLRTVSIARKTSQSLGSMELFQILCEVQAQLGSATVLKDLLDLIVGLIYEITSFHRVMVYQFDETAAGNVKSEIVNPRASIDIYRDLQFPASDIPEQARALYVSNTIRILYDREQETARLICREKEDAETPLDLKNSYLRAMSPIHLKYLTNMGVRASMSISLMVEGKLWGLISCHNYGHGVRVALPLRELCRGLGHIASTNIERVIYASRVKVRKVLMRSPPEVSPSSYLTASTLDLLEMFEADLGFLVIKGEARVIGHMFAYGECIALLNHMRQRALSTIFSSNTIVRDFQDIDHGLKLTTVAGILMVPLSQSGADFLVFLRKSQQNNIQWAGNPHQKLSNRGYLEPRSSFNRWTENVEDSSKEWTEDQLELAAMLSTLYGRFIEVWRQKAAIVQKNQMTRVLIRNAGHEVRTPLNSVINYLEMALEENLDESARAHLQKSLQASKSLVFVVNDLLHLTEAEDINFLVHEDDVALTELIDEAIAAFKPEAERRNVRITLDSEQPFLDVLRCNPEGMRQVVFNLLANAVQNSDGGVIRIWVELLSTTSTRMMVRLNIQDQGKGLSEIELDSIFQDFEKILDDDGGQNQQPGANIQQVVHKRPAQIGLGLAITARFVRHNLGQIKVASDGLGKGTTVSVEIPFRKPVSTLEKRKEYPLRTHLGDKIGQHPELRDEAVLTSPYPKFVASQSDNDSISQISETVSPSTILTIDPIDLASPFESNPFQFPGSLQPSERLVFNVLVAEDNPLNSRLLDARLSRRGHNVTIAVDGRACLDAYISSPDSFDVILMDIQMPLVDGIDCTRMIRKFESESKPTLSVHASAYGRVPIIAVSASLAENKANQYTDIGFDGWMWKPIDFKRLETILQAVQDERVREQLLYGHQTWGKGGWFAVSALSSKENKIDTVR